MVDFLCFFVLIKDGRDEKGLVGQNKKKVYIEIVWVCSYFIFFLFFLSLLLLLLLSSVSMSSSSSLCSFCLSFVILATLLRSLITDRLTYTTTFSISQQNFHFIFIFCFYDFFISFLRLGLFMLIQPYFCHILLIPATTLAVRDFNQCSVKLYSCSFIICSCFRNSRKKRNNWCVLNAFFEQFWFW